MTVESSKTQTDLTPLKNTNGEEIAVPRLQEPEKFRCAVVTAGWNPQVTHSLRDGAVSVLRRAGVPDFGISLFEVPGTVELVYGAAKCVGSGRFDAVIVIGCVVRGDTPHFDYVCQQAAQGVASLNAEGKVPVIFGVLTVNKLQEALDRAGGIMGNKGEEAAVAALEMHRVFSAL